MGPNVIFEVIQTRWPRPRKGGLTVGCFYVQIEGVALAGV